MGSLWQAPAALIVLITWLTATPVSLSEISRRETLRRQATPRSTTALTNDDLPLWAPAVVSRPESPPVAEPGSSADVDDTIDPAGLPAGEDGELSSTDALTGEVQDEAWWRARMVAARTELEQSRQLLATRQSEIRALQADYVGRDDPMQRELVRQALEQATVEAGGLEQQIAAHEETVIDIQTEARRAGVPPGWVR